APPAEAPPPALPPGHPPTDLPPGHPAPRPAGLPPLPLAPPAIFPSQLQDEEAEEELVGIHGGRVFIRTPHDTFRFYPQMRLRTDFNWAPGAPDLPRAQEGQNLHPSLAVRRLRLEMSGEILERLAFTGGVELGGGRIGDTVYRGDGTSRFAKANGHDGRVRPGEVDVSYRFRKWLSITAGLFNAPFSMENRTREYATTFMERSLAIRGLVVPYDMDYGVSLWGEILDDRALNYEAAVMLGDGIDRPGEDARADYMARVFARPLTTLGDALFFQQAQIGLSLRHGERDQSFVAYDYPSIATNQGFVLWQPGYVDSLGRVTHVIPSGAQNAIGGELRLPIRMPTGAVFDIRGEAYFVSNNTREAVDGFVTTNTERLGRLKGVGWYGEISWWACFTDQLANGEPGIYRPYTVDLDHEAPILKAFQVSALVSGINANYDGATRGGSLADPNTPTSNIAIYQVGGAVQYWFNYNFRAALNYFAYITPGSGDVTVNQAVVPDNVKDAGDGHVHHELGARTAITF
ncbi:MAG: hypothetical protein KC731_10130, partial [Myxococcales bacterium]|nr:hypothetical protein [Myxococcales bacterium]